MKNKVRGVPTDEKMELQELIAQTEAVVDLVTRIISDLELVNQEIDDAVAEVDEYSTESVCMRVEFNRNRTRNTTIIANFTRLLEVPEMGGQPVA